MDLKFDIKIREVKKGCNKGQIDPLIFLVLIKGFIS